MFDKEYNFTGTHAAKVSELTAIFDETSKAKLFERNLDVYINAPLIGFLYQKKAGKNNDPKLDEAIFPEQLIKASEHLKYALRLILILDKNHEPDEQKRLDKAFRNLGEDENDMKLFDSYVLGGVDVLYEKLIVGSSSPDDYINKLFEFLDEFNDRFNSEISNDDITGLCISKKT